MKSRKNGLRTINLAEAEWISNDRTYAADKAIYMLGQTIGVTRTQPYKVIKPKYEISYLWEFYCGHPRLEYGIKNHAIIIIVQCIEARIWRSKQPPISTRKTMS